MRFIAIILSLFVSINASSMSQALCGSMLYVKERNKLFAYNPNSEEASFYYDIKQSSDNSIYGERMCGNCNSETLLSILIVQINPNVTRIQTDEFKVKELMKGQYLDLRRKETGTESFTSCSAI